MSQQNPSEQTLAHARRWRLVLGKYADKQLGQANFGQDELRLERSLSYLYNREYERRGLRTDGDRHGGEEESVFNAVNWLNQARKLFPQGTFERMQNQALERYQMEGLLRNPEAIRSLTPSMETARLLLNMRGRMNAEMQAAIRELISKVVDDILRRLKTQFKNAISGRRNRFRRSPIAHSQNFDWRATIAANLKNYDRERGKIIIQNPIFNSRMQSHFPWDIVLCVDQSGSMDSSIMYAAVCASILAGLPAVKVHLVVFDTQVVDLSHMAHDPVEVLMTVQLGGGTYIGKALQYCESKITNPSRTIVALISDFCEGGALNEFYSSVARMHGNKVKLLGLAALNDMAEPEYDQQIAQRLANLGMQVAALTPEHFAQWLAEVMQ